MDDVPDRTLNPPRSDQNPSLQGVAPPLLTARDGLLADFDGTLVELAESPEQLNPADDLVGLLQALRHRLGGALGVISGRRLESIDRWLAPLQLAGAGLHGSQMRPVPGPAPSARGAPQLAAQVAKLQARYAEAPGVLVEDKGAAIALHYRMAPERREDCRLAMTEVAQRLGFNLLSGHCVFEARPAGIDKGTALRELADVAPFAGRRLFFIGDDTTDEDAIRAVQAAGGIGVRVGPGETAAHHRLADVPAVLDWLRASLHRLGGAAT